MNRNETIGVVCLPVYNKRLNKYETETINKKKPKSRKGKVLFVNSELEYEEGKNQNKLREQDIEKIVATFDAYEDIKRYSKVVNLDNIKENDYNLNISRYVDTTEPEVPVDIPVVMANLKKLEGERSQIQGKLNGYLQELGL